MSSEKKTNKKIPKQRAIMYTQQMRLAILSDWKEEIDRIVKLLEPLLWAGILQQNALILRNILQKAYNSGLFALS